MYYMEIYSLLWMWIFIFCRCNIISLFLVSYLSCTVLLVAEISDKIHTRETYKATADKANQDYMKLLSVLAFH
jgi:hypothetical protein